MFIEHETIKLKNIIKQHINIVNLVKRISVYRCRLVKKSRKHEMKGKFKFPGLVAIGSLNLSEYKLSVKNVLKVNKKLNVFRF
jgi:hypothetical protein